MSAFDDQGGRQVPAFKRDRRMIHRLVGIIDHRRGMSPTNLGWSRKYESAESDIRAWKEKRACGQWACGQVKQSFGKGRVRRL